MTKQWSTFQQDIFSFVQNDTRNAIVRAVAGSGKTTTIVEAMKCARGSTVFLAFNKAIADELKARGVNARTFHSICYSPVLSFKNVRDTDSRKDFRVFNEVFPRERYYYKYVSRLVSLGKQMGISCLVQDTPEAWLSLVKHHELEPDDARCNLERAIEMASELLAAHIEDLQINFDDMLYLAVQQDLNLPKFDFIFVDEAQDTNAIQRAVLKKMMHEGTRIVAVGDPAQAIYGFRGADSDSMDLIAKEFNCVELPLTITYRCPTTVVKYAQQWVKDIHARDGAEEGIVQNMGGKWDLTTFKERDLIVCRTSRQLIALGFKLIREHIPCYIMGREIGDGLKSLIGKQNAYSLDELDKRIQSWGDREAQKALSEGDENKAEAVYDKVDAIRNIIAGMPVDQQTIGHVNAVIDYLFYPNPHAICLATIHKSKGLEADRVFWLGRNQCPPRWASSGWKLQQELNLMYVATTRAKKELYFLEERSTAAVSTGDDKTISDKEATKVACAPPRMPAVQ